MTRVDMILCRSNGQYELVAPEISELGDDTLRWKEEVDPSLRQKAVEACPRQAIRGED